MLNRDLLSMTIETIGLRPIGLRTSSMSERVIDRERVREQRNTETVI